MVTAIVVAAGLSSRMGTVNKMMLPYGGTTIVEHTVGAVLSSGIGEVVVVTGHEGEAVKEALGGLAVRIVYNENYRNGLSSSLQKGIRESGGDGYLLCLADMATIEPDEYAQIVQSFEEASAKDKQCICLPRYEGRKGNPVLFSAAWREELLNCKEAEGFKEIVQAHRQHIHWVDMLTDHVLQDIDSEEDYKRLA